MEKNIISATVKERRISVDKYIPPTAGNKERDFLQITLDKEWTSAKKRVTFYRNDTVPISVDWDGSADIGVPWEMTSTEGNFGFTVTESENGTDRLVTVAMRYDERITVNPNGKDEGVEPSEHTEDIIRRVNRIAEELEGSEGARESRFETFLDEAGADVQVAVNKAADAVRATEAATLIADAAAHQADQSSLDAAAATANANQAASDLREAAQRGDFNGKDGKPGTPGKDGKTPVKGVDYFDGAPGKTPVRGTDYWTAADVAAMEQHVDGKVTEYVDSKFVVVDAMPSNPVDGLIYMVRE